MQAWGIKTIKMPGYEADDILATLAAMGEKAGYEVLLVTGDRDAFQLITDNVFVLYPRKGVSDIPRLDAAAIQEKYFVTPPQYSDLAALVGSPRTTCPAFPASAPRRRPNGSTFTAGWRVFWSTSTRSAARWGTPSATTSRTSSATGG
jgi:DNA polymerase-1